MVERSEHVYAEEGLEGTLGPDEEVAIVGSGVDTTEGVFYTSMTRLP